MKIPVEDLPEKTQKRVAVQKLISKSKMQISKQEIREINFYVIPPYDKAMLDQAEEVAKKMKDTGFRLNSINRNYFQLNFGEDFARKVY
jgi:hypothetical protein